MGNVKITLDEAPVGSDGHWIDGPRVTGITYGTAAAYPGAVLDKDPTVHNVGNNSAYIRATVNVSDWMNLCAAFFPDFQETFPNDGYQAALSLLVGELGAGWSVVEVQSGNVFREGQLDAKFVLKYDGILAPSADTTPIFNHVYVPAAITNESASCFNGIEIVAQAIQASGFASWEEAFAAFDGA